MKYRKASEVLPDDLLREVQKYADGEVLYIRKARKRQEWGKETGAKEFYTQRNDEIRRKFREGVSAEALAEEYHLSAESIRKIVYCK